jgi:hypothetical protein
MTELEIRTAIDDALKRYCRGIDRLDGPSVASAFHPGAMLVDYGPNALTIEQFVEHALGSLQKKFVSTTHRLSNVLIELHGDWALVESYTLAHHVEDTPEGRRLHVFGGRYIDRFEDRGGVWLIAQRTLRNDWSHVGPMGEPMGGSYVPSGRAGTPDPIWG